MSILDKITLFEQELKQISESGIKNMRALAKEFKEAEIYFHIDLDGVTTAIGMKNYLKQYGIKTIDAHPIQYGSKEFAPPKGETHTLHVMVDFAHGKPIMKIHTDHHDAQTPSAPDTSTAFVKTPSNAEFVSATMSPGDIFPQEDLRIISTIDSADFASQDIEPDEILQAAFKTNPDIPVKDNHRMMGFVTNKLVLAYKNKPGFLKNLVLKANPSLISIYNITKALAKEYGYKSPEELSQAGSDYVAAQKAKSRGAGKLSDIKSLKSGDSVMIGNLLVQYGGGNMMKGGYDRYTPFKNNPEAEYLCIGWPMGLVQVSKNPFKKGKNPVNLGDLVIRGILKKHKSFLQNKEVSLAQIKRMFEQDKDFDKSSMGFTFNDLASLFDPKTVKGIDLEAEFGRKKSWKDLIKDIMSRHSKDLSFKQRKLLEKITITAWDIIISQSGGHHDITNITNLNFIGKGYTDWMKKFMADIAKEMKDMALE